MPNGAGTEKEYWQGWVRVQTQVEYLGKAVDDLKREVPQAIEKASVRLEAGARSDREQFQEVSARVRENFLRAMEDHEKRYNEDKKEYKEASRKTTMLWTIGIVLLALLQFLPLLMRLLGSGHP